jgi:MerR family copper efflux transcriptional regulator
MTSLSIGEIARRANVSIETVRYYERECLLKDPQRKPSGYRQYDDETVATLGFIRRSKELGFTLKEIKTLLTLKSDASATRPEVRQHANNKIAEIEAKIADYNRMRDALKSLVCQCHGDGSTVECPILLGLQGTARSS